ncbi:MAG: VWA domain-containing protein [Planctomycetes bacterium]|nr:VWA domain-containing protein [Planctomycetota bacterium]
MNKRRLALAGTAALLALALALSPFTPTSWRSLGGPEPKPASTLGILGSVRTSVSLYFVKNALPPSSGGTRPWWPQLREGEQLVVVGRDRRPEDDWNYLVFDGHVETVPGPYAPRRSRWVRPAAAGAPVAGGLVARPPGAPDREIPVPLKHTDVQAHVSGYVGTVEVRQSFENPFAEKIEAEYVFPLPDDAAVTDFVMTVGERRIRGIIRPREEARQIYQEARAQGYTATLLDQERANVFTQKVANLEPGKAVDVNLTYFHCLPYVDGWYEFVFPMVVGPRYNPPSTTDGIGAVARGCEGASVQATEVSYLPPGARTGHDIALRVDVDAGVPIEEVRCPTHAILDERPAPERATVRLAPLDTVPNRDFVLRFKVAGRSLKARLLTHRDERGGFFSLLLYPPEDLASIEPSPNEMIFVLDCSGSMAGAPIAKAKQAIARALKRLRPVDTFQLVQFSTTASQLGPAPLAATRANVRRGLEYLEALQGEGGTQMIEGIRAALDFPHDPERFRTVSFWTDGYIGNEADIFAEVERKLGASRLFSFGIGSSVNRELLDGLARLGRGAAAYVGLDEGSAEQVDAFYARVCRPALTDLRIDWGGLQVTDLSPGRLPDLFVGRHAVLTGRFTGSGKADVRVLGRSGGETKVITLPVDLDSASAVHPGIAAVWARTRIRELEDALATGREAAAGERIRKLALEHGLASTFTSFVAVDTLAATAGPCDVVVRVPVPMPEGVNFFMTASMADNPFTMAPEPRPR